MKANAYLKNVQKVVGEYHGKGVRSNLVMRQIRLTALEVLTGETQPDKPVPRLHETLLPLLKKDPGHKIAVKGGCFHITEATITQALAGGAYPQLDAQSLGWHSGPIIVTTECDGCKGWNRYYRNVAQRYAQH